MSIRPVVLNGMIQRTQDVGNLKQQEDNRPIVEQQNIQIEQQKHEDQLTHRVQDPEEKENDGYRYDAKEKGNNEYEEPSECMEPQLGGTWIFKEVEALTDTYLID